MTIYLIADLHGYIQPHLGVKGFPEARALDPNVDNYIIVLGDLGLVWDATESDEERYLLRWLDEKPFTLLFVDGNHENHDRLSAMPTVDFCGGQAHRLSEHCYHLMRGELYEIDGKTFFSFGGATSHDIENLLDPEDPYFRRIKRKLNRDYEHYRVIGKSWWASEEANDEEKAHGIETLEKHGWKCDYVLTHNAPASVHRMRESKEKQIDATALYLDEIRDRLDYSHWFSGHLHVAEDVTDKDHLIYHELVDLNEYPIKE